MSDLNIKIQVQLHSSVEFNTESQAQILPKDKISYTESKIFQGNNHKILSLMTKSTRNFVLSNNLFKY